jgi:hypothetical protein
MFGNRSVARFAFGLLPKLSLVLKFLAKMMTMMMMMMSFLAENM